MNLIRLREIAKKSREVACKEGAKLQFSNCMRSLKSYSALFTVDKNTFAQTVEQYFNFKYKNIKARYVDDVKECIGHSETKHISGFLKVKMPSGSNLKFKLFDLYTDAENPNYSFNLLDCGLVKSVFEPQNESEVAGLVADDVDEIAWATMSKCLARDAKIRREEKRQRMEESRARAEAKVQVEQSI